MAGVFRRTIPVLQGRKVGTAKAYYDQSNGLLRKLIPVEYIEKIKEAVLFRPDDKHDLHQVPPANMTDENVPRIQGYRYPAPGSQPTARVPDLEDEDRKYDIKYFTRNVRRSGHLDSKGRSTRFPDRQIEGNALMAIDDADIGSPGRPPAFPPAENLGISPLRLTMTATHEDTYKELQSHMATHNVKPDWEGRTAEIAAMTTAKGLPPVPGWDFDGNIIPNSKTAAW